MRTRLFTLLAAATLLAGACTPKAAPRLKTCIFPGD